MRAAIVVVLVAACDPYDGDLGPSPFLCGPTEPRCPDGYECLPDNGAEVCFETGSHTGDNCDDDGGSEPNDKLDAATPTGLDGMTTFSVEGRTICPGIDKDNYALTLSATTGSIELTVDTDGATLRAAILNQGGVPIATAAETGSTLQAKTQNLPAGGYYVQVAGPGGSLPTNHYKLTVVVGP